MLRAWSCTPYANTKKKLGHIILLGSGFIICLTGSLHMSFIQLCVSRAKLISYKYTGFAIGIVGTKIMFGQKVVRYWELILLEHVHMLPIHELCNETVLGLVRELDPRVRPNRYGNASEAGVAWVYCGLAFNSFIRESTINTSQSLTK